jgi:sialic acid synthase SpsE
VVKPNVSSTTPTTRKCRVIAVIDSNHNGDVDCARRLIDAARDAGATGVKLQKCTVSLAAVRQVLTGPPLGYGGLGATHQQALEAVDLSAEQLEVLCSYATGLEVVMAPSDLDAFRCVDPLPFTTWQLDAPLVTHVELLAAFANPNRPVIVEAGGCTRRELDDALARLGQISVLLHRVGVPRFTAGVADVAHLAGLRCFGYDIGYADTAIDEGTSALVAVCLGAVVVEKPLTLDRSLPGPAHANSLLPQELQRLVASIRQLESTLDSTKMRTPSPAEMDDLEWKQPSIVAARPIPRGTTLTREMLALKPPFRGLSPSQIEFLIGRCAAYDLEQDDHVTFAALE